MKSRERVKSYGEVFTPLSMVHQMLDLVSEELEFGPDFVDKTFLEPAAGDGNFLVAILERKLRAIETRFTRELWQQESLFALASIYGIELLEDNHQDAQEAMREEFLGFHRRHGVACHPRTLLYRAATFLIATNIVCGNTLTELDSNGAQIQFSWWNRVPGADSMVLREPFTLASIRDDSLFDFNIYETYAPCLINRVHMEVKGDG